MAWKGTKPTAFALTVTDRVGQKTRAAALQALEGVVLRSPVDTGRFRGNNFISVGSRNQSASDAADKSGQATLSAGSATIASATRGAPFTVIYIQNNLPYAQRLEDGYSAQAPGGIYAVTFNSLVEASR